MGCVWEFAPRRGAAENKVRKPKTVSNSQTSLTTGKQIPFGHLCHLCTQRLLLFRIPQDRHTDKGNGLVRQRDAFVLIRQNDLSNLFAWGFLFFGFLLQHTSSWQVWIRHNNVSLAITGQFKIPKLGLRYFFKEGLIIRVKKTEVSNIVIKNKKLVSEKQLT